MDCGEPGIGKSLDRLSGKPLSTAVQRGTSVKPSPATAQSQAPAIPSLETPSGVSHPGDFQSGDLQHGDPAQRPGSAARGRFIPAVLLMAAITLGLAWMAFTTANPVVISPPQVQEAACVIVGEVVKTAENRVKVISSLKGPLAEGTTIRVTRMPGSLLQGERRWILALEHLTDDRFAVVVPDSRYETAPEALVYPDTPQVLAEVQHWLKAPWPTRDVPPPRSAPPQSAH